MWNLVRLSLAYHWKTLLVVWIIATLLSKLGLVVSAIVGVALLSAEDKERRLLLHLPLPVTRAQVGLSRVVFPAMVLGVGTAASALLAGLSSAILVGVGAGPTANSAWNVLFFATMLMYLLQLLLTMGELQVWTGGRFLRTLMGGAAVVLLLGIAILTWIAVAMFGSYLWVALGTAVLTLGLMGLTVSLFRRRPSFTSG
jgi:hypothetical protein